MGLITDKDAEEAEQAVELDFPYLKKGSKIGFLNGFLDGWRKSKKSGVNVGPKVMNPKAAASTFAPQDTIKYLNIGIEKEPANFGRAFGTLIGSIEFTYNKPEVLFQPAHFEWIVVGINMLKIRAHFYQMAMKRIDTLTNKIKLEQLTAEQRKSFGALIANLK